MICVPSEGSITTSISSIVHMSCITVSKEELICNMRAQLISVPQEEQDDLCTIRRLHNHQYKLHSPHDQVLLVLGVSKRCWQRFLAHRDLERPDRSLHLVQLLLVLLMLASCTLESSVQQQSW